jgi:hypothetical protein
MARRDAFSRLRSDPLAATSGDPSTLDAIPGKIDLPPAVRPLDLIPAAEPRKKRERKWEKEHQAEIATYRGIPVETHLVLVQLADTLSVPIDEVARTLLEYSLNQYRTGSLQLHPHPKSQRMTLFPDGSQSQNQTSNQWLQQAFPARKPERKGKKGKTPKKWESRVTYRLPPELKAEVKEIADSHFVGVGELVLYLFLSALKAIDAQLLHLEAHPKVSGNTLF